MKCFEAFEVVLSDLGDLVVLQVQQLGVWWDILRNVFHPCGGHNKGFNKNSRRWKVETNADAGLAAWVKLSIFLCIYFSQCSEKNSKEIQSKANIQSTLELLAPLMRKNKYAIIPNFPLKLHGNYPTFLYIIHMFKKKFNNNILSHKNSSL